MLGHHALQRAYTVAPFHLELKERQPPGAALMEAVEGTLQQPLADAALVASERVRDCLDGEGGLQQGRIGRSGAGNGIIVRRGALVDSEAATAKHRELRRRELVGRPDQRALLHRRYRLRHEGRELARRGRDTVSAKGRLQLGVGHRYFLLLALAFVSLR